MIFSLTSLGMAEAATLCRVFEISSPVLTVWANPGIADALAVLNRPVEAGITSLRNTDAHTLFGIVTFKFTTGCHWARAFTSAFFNVEVIIIILVRNGVALAYQTITVAVILVPVESGSAITWGTDAFAVDRIPEEIVRALHWAADALADGFIEDFILAAFSWSALALTNVRVQVEARFTSLRRITALTPASLSVPEKVRWAVVRSFGFLAHTAADSCVKVVGCRTLVWLAQAAARD